MEKDLVDILSKLLDQKLEPINNRLINLENSQNEISEKVLDLKHSQNEISDKVLDLK